MFPHVAEATHFLFQVQQDGLRFRKDRMPAIKPQDGYYFVYDKKFRPLLDPPAPGQSKFDQVLEWAKVQAQ